MFDIELEGDNTMTIRDLFVYSDDKQEFILFEDVNKNKICFKGSLVDCPTELLDSLVHKFRGIDFNTIEVVLR